MDFTTVVLLMREERERRMKRKTWPRCIGITGGQLEEEDQKVLTESWLRMK